MKLHANAALSLNRRRQLARRVVDENWSLADAAAAAEVSERTASKWARRYRSEGEPGLHDRSSAPHALANRTPEDRVQAIAAIRRLRFTGAQIAELFEMPETTVSGILTRIGLGRLGRLGLEPAVRYERRRPGELIHIDVKKLGKIPDGGGWRASGQERENHVSGHHRVGYDYVHAAVDDHTRVAYAEILPNEQGTTCAGFLLRAGAFFADHGVAVNQVISDNAKNYIRSRDFQAAVNALGATHLTIRPHCPWQNGKVERFNRTVQVEWAYRQVFLTNDQRSAALAPWLDFYNNRRRHSAIGGLPPISRLS